MVAAVAIGAARATLCCAHCGRRLLHYEALGSSAVIRVRCRDCKGLTELHGADVPKLLSTLAAQRQGESNDGR